ncbi:MAG: preprotein translocase subunit SecE [Isosphaeraceae bacterium]
MGKVKGESAGSKAGARPGKAPAPKPSGMRLIGQKVAPFFANLLQTTWYKPHQGWYARLWTGIGLGATAAIGLYRLFEYLKSTSNSMFSRFGVPALLAAGFAWLIIRVLQYPPFVDFLIATEAEMNKVSWTSKQDLYRATSVVLVTVLLMSVYLFGVDFLWMKLLETIGVLKFTGNGAFGSTA